MASGNLIQGQGAGKLGDVVLMVRNGAQVARVYTKAGARSGDQASEASRIQRVKFGSASNQWSLYRYVCTRMYRKGRQSNQSDYNYFVKKNQHLLPFFTKNENADGIHCLMPGTFSEGSLGRIELVLSYYPTSAVGSSVFALLDTQLNEVGSVAWTLTIGAAKAALSKVYPSARKVTWLISYASEVDVLEEGETYTSQNITHVPITLDLYQEVIPGENDITIKEYFGDRIGNSELKSIISAQTGNFLSSKSIFRLHKVDGVIYNILDKVSVLFFATDDNVADCYTSVLPQDAVNPTQGAYAVWAGYRTSESLRLAADSYGYQSGVMRDSIAAVGNDITAAVTSYAAKLRSIDSAAAEEYLTSIGDVKAVQAKVVRKPTTASEDK